MPFSRFTPIPALLLVLAFVAGCAAVGYAVWAKPLLDADRALAAGQRDAALEQYAAAEKRFGRFRLVQYVFAREHAASIYNQLAILYSAGNYEAVLEKAGMAPAASAPHFWSGLVLLSRAIPETDPDTQLAGLSRAEEELKQALQATPDDWDTKFNFELAARLAAELRRQPKKKIDEPLRLLRPQPTPPRPTRKAG
jgi:tetratricopeptide (TPR) repeat protein